MTFKLSKMPDGGISGILKAGKGIGIISNGSDPALHYESVWNLVVGRDVIVPVMNIKNPFLAEINRKGISRETFVRIRRGSGFI